MNAYNKSFQNLTSNNYFWPIIIVLLAVPAFLINIDVEPLIGDEGIRGLVTLEMKLRHNLITPTLGGEYYFNKPPLYNWILLFFSSITGSFTDFMLRFPTVVFLALFTLSIYILASRNTSKRVAFYAAFMFLTCGRILFFDSFKGLIDMCFSWVIFLIFYAIWHYSELKQYRKMFIITYTLAAAAFLMKGIPAVAFLGISLFVYLFNEKKIRELFTYNHIIGIICFIIIIGLYYSAYYKDNPAYVSTLLERLVDESTKKSTIGKGAMLSFLHLATFPFEFIYYFLPWTFLVLYLFSSQAWKSIKANRFLWYCCLTFAGNIILYWISPDTFARYLFMFLPLVFIVLSQLYVENASKNTTVNRIIRIFFLVLISILLFALILPPFLKRTENAPFVVLKTIFLFSAALIVVILYLKKVSLQIELTLVFLLITRIGFDWFVMTDRYNESPSEIRKQEISKIIEISKGKTLHYDSQVNIPLLLNLTRKKMELLKYDRTYIKQCYYIVSDTNALQAVDYEKLSSLHSDRNEPIYTFVKIK